MRRVDGDARSVADSGGSLRLSASVDTSREYIKIGLYRFLFGVTDFNPRNVLITDDGRLYSIDENSMFERNFVFQPDKARSSPAAAYTKRGVLKDALARVGGVEGVMRIVDEDVLHGVYYKLMGVKAVLISHDIGFSPRSADDIVQKVRDNMDGLKDRIRLELSM